MKNLKGHMSFMRVKRTELAQSAVQMEAMGLNKNVIILMNGKMTKGQKKIVREKVRPTKILTAIEWLQAEQPS